MSHTYTHTYCPIEYRQGRGVAAGSQTRLSFPELLQFKCTLGPILGKAGRPFWAAPSGSRGDMVAFPSIESDLSQHRSQILHLPNLLKLPIACGKRGRAIRQAGERDLILSGGPCPSWATHDIVTFQVTFQDLEPLSSHLCLHQCGCSTCPSPDCQDRCVPASALPYLLHTHWAPFLSLSPSLLM